ncbi:uroporphyrinogen-III synthase [Rubellimicrobium rubrum]|uniref:Uroporphyrinogen-III synthase n=1 Tax=Rubellimicrobium rubrum TaxID=2585369 RepID=A0A5C4MTA8_9RHOB|nr:uroporphyrinogen-III synthase [Rubellimicrobium rubrum]TNC48191.1 uroporphyrinogen-III synthase [Rubellimicrobium rubrum]
MDGSLTLLLTRPLDASRRFLAECEAARGAPIPALLCPVMDIHPISVTLDGRPAALLLTSEKGAERAGDLGLGGLPAWCVGARTTAAARERGLNAIEAGPDAEGLLKTILAAQPPGPLLHLRGQHARGDLVPRLRAAGIDASEVVVYRQEALGPSPEARRALDAPSPLVAPLFSPRSAVLLAAWALRAPVHAVAMSEAVAEAAQGLRPLSLVVATRPDAAAMVEATLGRLDRLAGARLEGGERPD